MDFPDGDGVHILPSIRILCRGLVLLELYRGEAGGDGPAGWIRIGVDVYGRICAPTLSSHPYGRVRIDPVEYGSTADVRQCRRSGGSQGVRAYCRPDRRRADLTEKELDHGRTDHTI